MQSFVQQGSNFVPSINLNPQSGEFNIEGRMISIVGEGDEYFTPLLDWIKNYASKPAQRTVLEINLEYCSSGGIMILYQIFKIMNILHKNGHQVSVIWRYFIEDEDIEEKGTQFLDLVHFPFEVIGYEDD